MGLIMLILIGTVPTTYSLNQRTPSLRINSRIRSLSQSKNRRLIGQYVNRGRSIVGVHAKTSPTTFAPMNLSRQPFCSRCAKWSTKSGTKWPSSSKSFQSCSHDQVRN